MPKIGAHVSSAGSLAKSIEKAQNIGASCTQIFISPPQQWSEIVHKKEDIEKYRQEASKSGIGPNFIHGTYLINLATSNPAHLEKAISWLSYSLKEARRLGIEGVIFHLGSVKDRTFDDRVKQVCQAISDSLDLSEIPNDQPPYVILENCAGAGNLIGDNIDELAQIISLVNNTKVKVCLDTQHLFASGYDIRDKGVVDNVLNNFDHKIDLKNLVAIHANDSKTDFGSKRDRHENIGVGFLKIETFHYLLNHPKLQNLPFILEVPGFDDNGPDKRNIDLLKSQLENSSLLA